ncbi:hypothetical protein DICVIV_04467 [Dictyocaulus viviparus]|uniref:Uncharacterized protein n=1 Tax=Dictyocaulus viviparus TaxID=29172 RepID=A0A0D8Y034_DICVI|nr:hypothetical protein DICVIV_04467 [Dictyocaulus viviparus]
MCFFLGPLEIIAERESIYRLLGQVTKDNMNKMISKYTIDPRTRYVSLDVSLQPEDVVQIISSDNPRLAPIGQPLSMNNTYCVHENPILRIYSLWKFCYHALLPYILVFDMDSCWQDGRSLAGLVAKFFPEILDYYQVVIFNAVESIGITPPCRPSEWATLKVVDKITYIEKLVKLIKCSKSRLELALSPCIRSSQKKDFRELVCSRPKKSEPIQKLADNLLSCSTFTNECDMLSVHDYDKEIAESDVVLKKKEFLDASEIGECCHHDAVPSLMSVAAVQPERRISTSVMSALYDSVNVKRQEICRLCGKVVEFCV